MAGRKNLIRPYKILNAASMAADAYSAETNIEKVDVLSIMIDWAKTATNPNGVLYLQVQNGDSAWQTFATLLTLTGAAASGSTQTVQTGCHFEKMRLFWDRTSGDGTMTATLVAKTMGA